MHRNNVALKLLFVTLLAQAGCSSDKEAGRTSVTPDEPLLSGSDLEEFVESDDAQDAAVSEAPALGPDQEPEESECPPAEVAYDDEAVVELVNADAKAQKAKGQDASTGQTIYISLAHLAEDHSTCEMRFLRFGVGKLMNMMSWAEDIVAPEFIDDEEYIARIDVSELKWDPAALAYMVSVSNNLDYGMLSDTSQVIFRADWLASYLTRPASYSVIMRNEATERFIEAQMGVALDAQGQLGGVSDSIVTLHPRILERRESEYGACWISHDFLHRPQALAVLESGMLPQPDLRFAMQQYLAREYICNLPNGMHAYHLTGFVSQRRWDGNTCVARNRNRDDNLVLNGQCFACHSDGLIPFEDEVRANKTNPSPYIEEHYPTQDELAELIAGDQERFHKALEQIPYYEENFSGPLNMLMAVYQERSGDTLLQAPAGAFGAILPAGASGGPLWENLINPLATLAVDVGVLLPAELAFEVIPEVIVPGLEQRYDAAGIDPNMNCE